jgi:GT2 family glycosyltransferase
VNEGYSYTSNHFIILNTDTEVPPFWLERVIYPIINMDNIASTTPFTNSGEIASFPNFIADNNIFEEMSVDELDKSFRDVNAKNFYAKAPTGVGFCMGVNYNLIQEIGFFIEKDFGKGYGEENDWCQRAIKNGYSNLIVPNLFVYHKHGGSFTAEQKKKLIQENSLKLLKRYPNYDKDVQDYINLDPHKTLRQLLVIISTSKSKGVYLMINQLLGGGSNIYFKNRVDEYKKLNRAVLELIYNYYSNSFYLYFSYKDYNFKFELDTTKDIEEIFKNITCREIFVNNLVSFKDISLVIDFIESISKRNRAKLIIPIHDYFMICPNYTLLNQKNIYCNIPNIDECEKCLSSSNLEWKTFINENIDIRQWRDNFKRLIDISSQIIAFSTSSKDIFLKAYKDIDSSKIKIIPHKVEPLEKVTKKNYSNLYTTIGILGAINEAKGASILEELLKKIDKQNLPIKIVLIGDTSKALSSKNLKITGKYIRDDLPKITEQEEIDIFLIPSICPETFSYTTQEIIMMDMPLMVFNMGAPANRAKEYKKGVVLEPNYVDSVMEYITNNE